MLKLRLGFGLLGGIGLAVASLGCGGPDEGSQNAADTELNLPTITFHDDWSIEQSAPLVAGRRVRVVYDEDRLAEECGGGLNNGEPAWTITGYYSINGDEAESFWAGGFSPTSEHEPAEILLPESGDLAMWFHVTNIWGCIAWDSDYCNNFHFVIE